MKTRKHHKKGSPGQPGNRRNGRLSRRCRSQAAYSLLEVQIAMIVLTAGLMGLSVMLRTHSLQMEVAESWCRQDIEYYIVSQSNTWMRRLGMPAELTTEPDLNVWEPPVSGEQAYEVELDSFVLDFDTRMASAAVKLKKTK